MTIVVSEQLFYLEVNMDEIRTNGKELEMTDAMVCQQDLIDNATYDVCCSYLGIPDEEREKLFPWDMRILAEVRESITDALLPVSSLPVSAWISRFTRYCCMALSG